MRKLVSKSKAEKNQRRNQIILGVILMIVMVASTFAIITDSFGNEQNSGEVVYNNIEFLQNGEIWIAQIEGYQSAFKHNPKETPDINTFLNPLGNYYRKPLYIDSNDKVASSEIYNNLNRVAQRIQFACLEEENCEENLPIKTCEDNFIIIRESNKSRIFQEDNCVFIEGSEGNLSLITDEFLFRLLKVKQ